MHTNPYLYNYRSAAVCKVFPVRRPRASLTAVFTPVRIRAQRRCNAYDYNMIRLIDFTYTAPDV